MRKLIISACIFLCIIAIILCFALNKHMEIINKPGDSDDTPYSDQATLIINGMSRPFGGVFFYQLGGEDSVHVPFLAFLDALGYQITQIDDDIVSILIDGKEYFFLKETGSLFESGDNKNLFVPYNGRDSYNIDVRKQEAYLEVKTISETLNSIGIKMSANVSCGEKMIIIITG